ncbi:nodulin-26-like [Salvia hispanica]|uniref:nodulin-26-like n=1 Tax=Salvia hispanica TaxID=49212 RepID=UPI00200982AC|nr:nodulin-26-like [Salvia hispanica]
MANSPSIIFSINSPHTMPADIQPPKHNQTPKHHQPLTPSHFQKIIAEVVGTYVFVFAGCGAALVYRDDPTALAAAFIPALALMAMIYAVGHVSGAHFNPAVTVAFAVACRLPFIQVPIYVLSQLFGSTLASFTLRLLFKHQINFVPMLTQYSPTSTSDLEAIVWEFILTFILIFTIFGVASDDRANNALCGVAIGGALLLNALIGGSITGASMNPARSLGPAVAIGVYKNQWVYAIAPLLGGVAASVVYSLLRPTQSQKLNTSVKSVYTDLYHPQV